MTTPSAPGLARLSVNPMAMLASPFDEEYRQLAAAGARRIGLAVRKLAIGGWDEGVALARASGLQVDYLVHGVLAPVGDGGRWRVERDLMLHALDTAAELGAPVLYFCSGPPGDLRFEEAVDALGERLAPVIERAAATGVRLAVENALSVRTDFGFIFTLRDALAVARALGIAVCADMYCCWLEPDLVETLRTGMDTIAMVQLSDRDPDSIVQPDRRVPGDGRLPLERIITDVLGAGYRGTFDLELLGPAIDREGPAAAVARGLAWLAAALDRCGAGEAPDPG